MGFKSVLKKIGKVAAAPVVVPAKLVKKGMDKAMQAAIISAVRYGVAFLGGNMVHNGVATGSELESIIGAVVTLVTVAFSVVPKLIEWRAKRKAA